MCYRIFVTQARVLYPQAHVLYPQAHVLYLQARVLYPRAHVLKLNAQVPSYLWVSVKRRPNIFIAMPLQINGVNDHNSSSTSSK